MLRYDRQTETGLVALYDIRPGNWAGPFLQPRSPHEAHNRQAYGLNVGRRMVVTRSNCSRIVVVTCNRRMRNKKFAQMYTSGTGFWGNCVIDFDQGRVIGQYVTDPTRCRPNSRGKDLPFKDGVGSSGRDKMDKLSFFWGATDHRRCLNTLSANDSNTTTAFGFCSNDLFFNIYFSID